METRAPWLELSPAASGWEARFALQVCLQPLAELQRLRWGMNAAVLMSEALDRQRLFIESQFHGNPLNEPPGGERALALRALAQPGQGILLGLIGRVRAADPTQARERAHEYHQELTSIFPYDYKLYPALTRPAFEQLTGQDVLTACKQPRSMAQILRFESSLRTRNNLVYLTGFWQTSDRADEQIWRVLGNFSQPVLFNVTLQPAILEGDERQLLWEMKAVSNAPYQEVSSQHPAQPFEKWVEPFIERRLNPWKRYYLVQVHLLCPAGVSDSLARPVAAALTRETADLLAPGFAIAHPPDSAAAKEWRARLNALELTLQPSDTARLSRLRNLADLNEACCIFRFPYPPDPGLPGVKFLPPLEA